MCFGPDIPKTTKQEAPLAIEDTAQKADTAASVDALANQKKAGRSQLVIDLSASNGVGLNIPA